MLPEGTKTCKICGHVLWRDEESPANVRHVTPKQGNNPAHTHVNVPPSLAKKMTGGK